MSKVRVFHAGSMGEADVVVAWLAEQGKNFVRPPDGGFLRDSIQGLKVPGYNRSPWRAIQVGRIAV